jgi:arylsulfatase A-like enzyme
MAPAHRISARAAGRAACCASLASLFVLGGCSEEPARDNVLLVVVDTLRADHLSCYGYERETSPCIDRLASNGILFTHAESPRAKTTPAVTSLLTGLYPHDHGVRDLTTPLRREVPTLAGVLREHGWRTAAIVGNYVLRDELSGLARDFDTWIEELPTTRGVPPDDVPERTADSITDGAIELLRELARPEQGAARPWFLWLHYMDPHGLYEPPSEHAIFHATTSAPIDDHEAAAGEPPLRVATYNVPAEAWLPDGRIDAAPVVDRYDGEIHFADAEIGRLLDRLRDTGALEHTWVVLVADHGESLGERRYWFEHGAYAHEATCRVPLIVHAPLALRDRPAPGVRESDLALADLGPTLLELLGQGELPAAGSDVRGRSRAALLAGDDERAHPVFCEKVDAQTEAHAVQTKAVRIGDWKLAQRLVAEEAGKGEPLHLRLLSEELYDLSRDKAEAHDLSAAAPADAPLDELREALAAFVRADRALPELDRSLDERARALQSEDPETARRLRALGY